MAKDFNNKKVIRLSESDLRQLTESVIREMVLINENQEEEGFTYNDMFGLKTRRENRINAIKYAKQFGPLSQRIQAIADEIDRRIQLLQSKGQINEVAGAVSKLLTNMGIKGVTKAGAKAFGKKMAKKVGTIGLASIPAFIIGPQNIQAWFQKFNTNRAQATPKEVISAYDELTNWMINICSALQQHPEILGAGVLEDSTLNGPEEVQTAGFGVGDAVELAASCAVYAIPYVGWALGALDLAHSLVHAGATANKEGLQMVANQVSYLQKAIANIEGAFAKADNPQAAQQAQQQTSTAQQEMPQGQVVQGAPEGYIIGQPAPFAKSDPEQVKRLQSYLGLQPTGRWDNNTQNAWNRWLQNTYGTKQSVARTATNVGKNIGRAVMSR